MVNEVVEVIVVKKLRRKGAVWVSYCDLLAPELAHTALFTCE